MNKLTFETVAKANAERCQRWHQSDSEPWTAADWSNAMAGEAGEVCNAVKKLRRLETRVQQHSGPQERSAAIAAIATEIGDTFLYLDLLAQHLNINLAEAVRDTFNRVSIREGFPDRL